MSVGSVCINIEVVWKVESVSKVPARNIQGTLEEQARKIIIFWSVV